VVSPRHAETKIDSIVFGTKIDALATPAGTSTSPCHALDLYHYHDDDEDDYLDTAGGSFS
jgi:hypothetical protein